jgi:hypothetical protein
MGNNISRKRALEILADPHAKESEWLGALSILDGKLPALDRNKKTARFVRRVASLTLMYTALFYSTSLIDQMFFQQFSSYTLWYIAPIAFLWALVETCTGLFTLYAAITLAAFYWTSLMSFNPVVHTIWMIILLNISLYFKWRWAPYVFVPIGKAMRRCHLKAITNCNG